MKRYLIIATVLTILLLAAFTGGALAHEEGLLLEGFAEALAGLVERVDVIDDRVAVLESQAGDSHIPDTVYLGNDVCQNPLHTPHTDIVRGEITQETADAYRIVFGVSTDPDHDVYLTSIAFAVEGNEVYLEYTKDDRRVVETWANCEFLGHSNWRDTR